MKTRFKFLTLAAAFGLVGMTAFTSCSHEETYNIIDPGAVKDSAIQILLGYTVQKSGDGTRAAATDNAAIVEPTLLPGNVGVWFQPADGSAWTSFFKSMYTYAPTATAGELTLTDSDKPYYPATLDGKVKLGAWYPADAIAGAGLATPQGTFTVKTDQTSKESFTIFDLMFGTVVAGLATEFVPSKTAIPLVFTHQLSKVTVKLVAGNTDASL